MPRSTSKSISVSCTKQPIPATEPKAKFTLRSGRILLGTYDDAGEVWAQFDVLLASGVDVTIEVVPAVLG